MAYKMKDVAERAGVSVTTVSHLLNRTRRVAPETRQRIMLAVRELNYHKNVHARRLSMNQSDLFGLVISEIANPFFPEIIKGFQSAAWEQGFEVLLYNTEYDPARSQSAIRKLIESDVRGVAIMTSAVNQEWVAELTRSQIGVVCYNLGSPGKWVGNIRVNFARGIVQAIDHITRLGHERIAVIGGPQTNRAAIRIQNVTVGQLKRHGISPALILESNYRVDGGVSAVQTMLSQAHVPTAILCGNDLIAMGAMSALEEARVRVPDEVSVVGFDDIFFARLARPPLTTVSVPREDLGRLAFKALDRMFRAKRKQGVEFKLDTSLVVRKSTTSPPQAGPSRHLDS